MNSLAFGELKIDLSGQPFVLSSFGSVWQSEVRTLYVADLHLGKSETFRARGLPVPLGAGRETLLRLKTLAKHYRPQRLVILGDLWHSKVGRTAQAEADLHGWRSESSHIEVILVRGNHDLASGEIPSTLHIRLVDEGFQLDGIELNHHPKEAGANRLTLCGHIHPAVRLAGKAGLRLTLPCYWCRGPEMVLPAFGVFTGKKAIRLSNRDLAYAVLDDSVFLIRHANSERE